MNQVITKKEFMSDLKTYFSIEDLTRIKLQNYIKIGLIKRLKHYHTKGQVGSQADYPKNSPGMIYLIKFMKERRMKLREIRSYLDLLELNLEAVRDIKDIIEDDRRHRENILFKEGITPEIKDYLLKEIPLKLLDLKKLTITRFERLKQIITLRAYAELDQKEITEIIIRNSKDLDSINKINKIEEILNSPGVETNIDKIDLTNKDSIKEAYISVRYGEPFYKTVLFKEGQIEVICD